MNISPRLRCEVGDLVIVVVGPEILMINQYLDKVCVVIKVYPPEHYVEEELVDGFHYRISDCDGNEIDVWCSEVKKI